MRFDQDRSAIVSNRDQKGGNGMNQPAGIRPHFGTQSGLRRRLFHLAVLSSMTVMPTLATTKIASGENLADVVLGSGSFQIPFNIASGGSAPREVQLYMASSNGSAVTGSQSNSFPGNNAAPGRSPQGQLPQGQSQLGQLHAGQAQAGQWKLLDRQAPGVGQFQVSETPEGTFWFATRTIDANGRPHPPGPIEPELKVTVDTSQPIIHLAAEADANGKVLAEFTVEDATGADQMTVHYVTDTTRQWQTATIDRTTQGGRFAFLPTDNWQQLSLRLRVLDRAGNETIVKKRVQKPRVATTHATRFASSPTPSHVAPFSTAPSGTEQIVSDHVAANAGVASPAADEIVNNGLNNGVNNGAVHQLALNEPQTSGDLDPSGAHEDSFTDSAADEFAPSNTTLAAGPLGPNGHPGYASPFQFGRTSPTATNQRFAADAGILPPPATPQQLSQDFSGSQSTPYTQPAIGSGTPNSSNANPRQGLPAIELLPTATPDQPQAREAKPQPRTPAEAMRPLNSSSNPNLGQNRGFDNSGNAGNANGQTPKLNAPPLNPTNSNPQNLNAARGSSEPSPETSFQTENIPAPAPQAEPPTTLNRPAIEDTRLDRNDAPESESVNSQWSAIDSSRPPAKLNQSPSQQHTAPHQDFLNKNSSGQSVSKRHSVKKLSLEELSKRSVVRHSESRQFSLDFEIEAIGGRGVESIELYGTTDGGATWKHWGDDPDKASPFDIETNGEGIFGFNIVVIAANGLASPRPLPGDVPDIVVVVDETKPEVSLSGARYGEGDRAGSLVIQYRCEDQYLMARPISLAFGDSPDGPWTTIAAGLRNLGDYVWPADPQLPRQIYLRIDATDQAGNVGGYVLEEPIDTRGLAPRARIRAFRSIPTR
ncbi:hypothetical protein [Neorhodopirellula lusitana]|uniref:hypothetical protein n=1 Tax=Neorhodopirellula lusitana TaxID=445327 RepID=UPI00384E5116